MDRPLERKKWKEEISAGGVVFRDGPEGREVLLIESSLPDKRGKWAFPKGWVTDHPGEKYEDTAVREVREEGGVNAEVLKSLGEVHYIFTFKGTKISKTVHYFLMRYLSGDTADHDHEVREARFVPWNTARDMLEYETDKQTFEKAEAALKS